MEAVSAGAWTKERLQAFLENHARELRSQIRVDRRWRHLLDVEDVLQITYLEAFQSFHQLRDFSEKALLGWLANSARNNLRDAVRGLAAARRTDGKNRVEPGDSDQSEQAFYDQLRIATTTPSRELTAKELRAALHDAMKKLPESYAGVIAGTLAEQTVAEIAKLMGRTEGAVYMLRSRAYERLRDHLGASSMYFQRT